MKRVLVLATLAAVFQMSRAKAVVPRNSSLPPCEPSPSDSLLFSKTVAAAASPYGTEVEIKYIGDEDTAITCIQALSIPPPQEGTADVIEGGSGNNHVVILFSASPGHNISNYLYIWGQ